MQSADLHMAQLMPLPLTISCFIKIQIGFTFLVPEKRPLNGCVCVCGSIDVGPILHTSHVPLEAVDEWKMSADFSFSCVHVLSHH